MGQFFTPDQVEKSTEIVLSKLTSGHISGKFGSGKILAFITSLSWVVPAGVTSVRARVWGGGGNGAPAQYGGGGGGGFAMKVCAVTPGQVIPITVGGPSGTSSFGTFVSATGGQSTTSTAGGSGGTGTGGDVNSSGGTGGSASNKHAGGGGVGTLLGNGGAGCGVNNASDGLGFSGGSGGGGGAPADTFSGGAGGAGITGIGGINDATGVDGKSSIHLEGVLAEILDYIGTGGGGAAFQIGATTNQRVGNGVNGGGGGGRGGLGGFPGGGGGAALNVTGGFGARGLVTLEW